MILRQAFWALAGLLENPTSTFGRVMWVLIAGLLAVILFVLAVHAGGGF
jgi:tetrahydromethanopterin S-methyltransferase subunit B